MQTFREHVESIEEGKRTRAAALAAMVAAAAGPANAADRDMKTGFHTLYGKYAAASTVDAGKASRKMERIKILLTNVPLKEREKAQKMSDDEFFSKYGKR